MPKDKLTDYSATNASNTDVGGVNTDEGMLPSAVNNAIREVMTHLKNFASGTDGIDVLSLADDDASAAMKIQAPASVTADTTLTLPDGDGDDGQALVTDGSGTLSWASLHSAKNLIINGSFQVAQRGSVPAIQTAYTACDRFAINGSGTAARFDSSQSTDVPSGQGFSNSLKLDVSTADTSISAGDFAILYQLIEAQNLQHLKYGTASAEKCTLSFWVKSPKTGTHIIEIAQMDAGYYNPHQYNITTANTWQKVEITFDGYQTTAINNDNGAGLSISFWLVAGSNFTSGTYNENTWGNTNANRAVGQVNIADSTSNDFYLTGVQLTVGDVDLPFIHESYAETLTKCQRYYHRATSIGSSNQVGFGAGTAYSATVYLGAYSSPVSMRETPDIGTSGSVSIVSGTAVFAVSTIAITGDTRDFRINIGTGSNMTVGRGAYLQINQNGVIDLDAEL